MPALEKKGQQLSVISNLEIGPAKQPLEGLPT